MSKGSKKSTSSATSSYTAPAYLTADTQNALQDATSIYNQGAPSYYPDQTYANFTPLQNQAMDQTVQLASDGSPLVKSAQGAVQNILDTPSGTNPYLDQYLQTIGAQTQNNVNQSFNANGRFGSGSNAATAATAVTNAQLPFLFNQYNTDQGNKLTAATEAPGLADYDFNNLARIGAVGDAQQQMGQNAINDKVNAYNYNATAPENWLNNYLTQLNSSNANNWGTSNQTNTQTTSGGSALSSILGGALALGGLFTGGATTGLGAALGLGGMGSGIGSLLGSFITPTATEAVGAAASPFLSQASGTPLSLRQ